MVFHRSFKGPSYLLQLAQTNRIIAEALKLQKNPNRVVEMEFPVMDLSVRNGWDSGIVKRELKNLQWQNSNGKIEKSGLMVEFSDLAFHFVALANLSDDDLEEILEFLVNKTSKREQSELSSLFHAYRAFSSVAQSRNSTKGEDSLQISPGYWPLQHFKSYSKALNTFDLNGSWCTLKELYLSPISRTYTMLAHRCYLQDSLLGTH